MIDLKASSTTSVEELGNFASAFRWEDISEEAQAALKGRVLDAIGCGIGALKAAPIAAIHRLTTDLGGMPLVTLIGGGQSAPDRGAGASFVQQVPSFFAPLRVSCVHRKILRSISQHTRSTTPEVSQNSPEVSPVQFNYE